MDYADTGGGNDMHGGHTFIIVRNTCNFTSYEGEISYDVNPKEEGDVLLGDCTLLDNIL